MKRIISVMLVIAMVLSLCMPVLAVEEYISVGDGTTTVSAKSFYEHTAGGSSNASPTYEGNYFKYRLNFTKAGMYKVYIKNLMFNDGGSGTIHIGDNLAGTGTIPNSGGASQTTEFCTISVDEGNCIFKYTNGTAAVYLTSFIFEYIGPRNEYNIKGNDYTKISSGVTDNMPSTGMSTNSYAEYVFTADAQGTYGIFARVASVAQVSATVKATMDGNVVGDAVFTSEGTGTGWGEFTEVYIGSVSLDIGEHTLEMKAAKSSMRLSSIRLKVVQRDTEEAFLSEMQASSNHTDIIRVLAKYNDKLIIPYNDYINKLYYRRVLDEQLLSLTYESLAQTDSQIRTLLEIELANPLVTVIQNGQSVTELNEGSFTVNIAPRFEESLVAIAALYTDDYMTLKVHASTNVSPYKEAEIKGLTATADGKKLKVFFFEDTDSIRPVEMPEVMQTQIFVSPDGSDTNDGLPSRPLATIEGAIARVNELNHERQRDITVFLGAGEYVLNETITLDESFSGNDDYGVHFKSLTPGEPAVISGGYDIKGWSDTDGDGIYTAKLPDSIKDVRQLYIDEQPAQRARSDKYYFADNRWDNEENNLDSTGKATGHTEDGFDTYNSEFPRLNKPKDAELAYLILWTVQRLPVEDIVYNEETGRTLIKMEQPYYSNAITMYCDGGIQPTIGHRFTVENDLTLLDEEGEFYFDKDTKLIYYMPFGEEDMSEVRTVAAKTEQLISLIGSSDTSKIKNITFDDIKFRYGGYYTKVNAEGAVSFQAENLANAASGLNHNPVSTGKGRTLESQITVENAEGIEFNNCDIACMGSSALKMGTAVTDSSVTGCVFTDIGGGALSVGTWEGSKTIAESILIKNNVISRIGLDFMFCPALTIYYAKNVSAVHNTIAHTPYSGISVGWGWAYDYNTKYLTDENGEYVYDDNGDKIVVKDYTKPSTSNKLGAGGHNISYNRIYDISRTVVDGGHVYNLGFMTESHVTNNYLTDSPDFAGVYLDSGASNVKIKNNVFKRCKNDDVAFGRSPLVVGNVADDNWSDKAQKNTTEWPGEGCTFEAPIVVTDDNWPDKAQEVMNNAGVEKEYEANLQRLNKSSWRTIDHHKYPSEEGLEPGVIYVNAGELESYYIKSADAGNKTEPALFTFSGITGVGDFRQGEWAQYKVDIPSDGDYTFTVQYSRGDAGRVNVYLGEAPLGKEYDNWVNYSNSTSVPGLVFHKYNLPATNTKSTGYIPHVFTDTDGVTPKVLALKKGTYYLRFLNLSGGFNFSRFKLTPVSTDK